MVIDQKWTKFIDEMSRTDFSSLFPNAEAI